MFRVAPSSSMLLCAGLSLLAASGCKHFDEQKAIIIYGNRHDPVPEGAKVWLKLRPDGHSAWASERFEN